MHYHGKLRGQPDPAWRTAKKRNLPQWIHDRTMCVWRWFFAFLGTEWIWSTAPIWFYFIGPDSSSFSHLRFSSCLSDTIFFFFPFFLSCTFYKALSASIENLPEKFKLNRQETYLNILSFWVAIIWVLSSWCHTVDHRDSFLH